MTDRPSKPLGFKKNGVAARLAQFFCARGDEYLSYEDIETKFGCHHKIACEAVAKLKAAGLVKTMPNPSGGRSIVVVDIHFGDTA